VIEAQTLLLSLFAPYILWPIEILFPRPQIVEELFKFLILLPLVRSDLKPGRKIVIALLAGLGFALTESVFYLYKIFLAGGFSSLIERLLLTIPLHMFTYFLILIPSLYKKKLMLLGLVAAIVVHYYFNLYIALRF